MRLLSIVLAVAALSPAAYAGSSKSSSSSSSSSAPSVSDPLPAHEDAAPPAKPARTQLPDAAILPAKGDIGIGFDAAPTLTYLGSFLSNAGGNGAGLAAYPSGFEQMLYVKYYLSPTMAARARVGLTLDDQTTASYEPDPVQSADPKVGPDKAKEVKNTVTETDFKLLLGGGAEMRRGYRRLQGFVGGEGIIGLFSHSSKSVYGWQYSKTAQENGVIGDGTQRELSSSSGLGFVIGARGFVGVEYFFVRKISVAAEYGYGLSLLTVGRGTQQVETWSVNDKGVGSGGTKTNTGDGAGSRIRADVDNGIDQLYSGGTGSVSVLFHF